VKVERPDYDAGARYIDRVLEQRVARLAFGDAVAKRRDLPNDAPLRKALELLQNGKSQRDLLARAAVASADSQR
jgi:hypothetical protein